MREVFLVLVVAGEVAALHLHAEVAIEVDGDADGCVGIVDTLELIAVDAAIDWMEVAVPAVDIDS